MKPKEGHKKPEHIFIPSCNHSIKQENASLALLAFFDTFHVVGGLQDPTRACSQPPIEALPAALETIPSTLEAFPAFTEAPPAAFEAFQGLWLRL